MPIPAQLFRTEFLISFLARAPWPHRHDMLGWVVFILVAMVLFFRLISNYALFKFNFQKR